MDIKKLGVSLILMGIASFALAAPASPAMLKIQNSTSEQVRVNVILGAAIGGAGAPKVLDANNSFQVPFNPKSPSVTLQLSSKGIGTQTCSVMLSSTSAAAPASPTVNVCVSSTARTPTCADSRGGKVLYSCTLQ